jgi:hypothetical protein
MSDVRDFGAAGDGVTDDTEAIRHAIQQGDGHLFFPRGDYRITDTIEIPLGEPCSRALSGEAGNTCLRMHGAGAALRILGHHEGTGDPASWTPAVLDRERLPSIRHLVIEGKHAEADGIELNGVAQPILEGLLVRRLRHGIRLVRRNRNVIISHCHVYHNTGVGVFLDGVNLHQINISASHISYNRLGGIRIERSEVRNLQITGNDIEYNNARSHPGLADEPTAEIYVDTTRPGATVNEVTIASNTIQATASVGGANIRIKESPGTDRPPGLWAVTGNVIGSQEVNVHLSGCYGMVLSGNSIYSCSKRNLLLEDSQLINITGNSFRRHTPKFGTGVRLERSTDCLVSNCQFQDEASAGQESKASLLEIDSCRRINVQGNQMLDGAPYGVDVESSSDVRVCNCMISEQRETRVAKGAVRFAGTGERNHLSANTSLGAIDIDEASGVTMTDH